MGTLQPSYFCTECGIELDIHDVDANLATWGVFRGVCSDDVQRVDERENPTKTYRAFKADAYSWAPATRWS